jgi:hypothetical protein
MLLPKSWSSRHGRGSWGTGGGTGEQNRSAWTGETIASLGTSQRKKNLTHLGGMTCSSFLWFMSEGYGGVGGMWGPDALKSYVFSLLIRLKAS